MLLKIMSLKNEFAISGTSGFIYANEHYCMINRIS
jgi:hypothetical protein